MQNEVLEILKKTNAIITNSHFVGTSGKHFDTYINKDALYPHTQETSRVCELFARKFKDHEIDIIAAPALGGIILSTWTAYHLSRLKNKEVLAVYTEKTPEKNQIFTRGYDALVKGKRLLIIEDLTTTGGSIKKVIDTVKSINGKITAACVMVNRDPEIVNSQSLGVPFSSLAELVIPSYTEETCPLCLKNISINTTVGHGKKYLKEKTTKITP
jgi:orotate phosphoribosyltransferase